MLRQELREAWQEQTHAQFFDGRATYSLQELRRDYESLNEGRLFLEHKHAIHGHAFVEIGCATGEFYRYLRHCHPEFNYHGFDISQPAVDRARQKYSGGRFDLCKPDLSDVIALNLAPAVLWARDVLHHQPDPLEYLAKLLAISDKVVVLRIRTRDKGRTVLDPDQSCQWHYNHWVPYIIFNMDEMVEAICKIIPVKKMFIVKRYVQLGGLHNRFLPKECYYPQTGTAETSLYIIRAETESSSPEIVVSSQAEVVSHAPLWRRAMRGIRHRLSG